MSSDLRLRCSFCGKSKDGVKKFISGPSVYICNECVALCVEILVEDGAPEPAESFTSANLRLLGLKPFDEGDIRLVDKDDFDSGHFLKPFLEQPHTLGQLLDSLGKAVQALIREALHNELASIDASITELEGAAGKLSELKITRMNIRSKLETFVTS